MPEPTSTKLPVLIKAYRAQDAYDEFPNCTLDTTLAEVKAMIRKEQYFEKGFDTIYVYHHLMGEEIQCPDSKTLRDIFALGDVEHAPEGEPLELKVDYNTPTSGYVDISYVGDMPSVKILDHNRRLQEVPATGGPKSVNLPNTWAFAFDFWPFHPSKKLNLVDKELKGGKLAVKEYCVEEKGQITIKKNGGSCEIDVGGKPIRNNTPRIREFRETREGSHEYDKTNCCPVLYDPADKATFWARHEISKDMVTKALNVCRETYDNTWDAINPRELPEPNAVQRRMVIGNTRCVLQHYPSDDTLYIGFRGSADKQDWLSNIQFELVSLVDGGNGDVKIHKGFKERADNILEELPTILKRYDPLPARIVTCGHSLGAAISQLVHIQIEDKLEKDSKCKMINITFAPPMVGNLPLRSMLNHPFAKRDLARNMHNFIVAEDIVPAALFTGYVRQKIHLYDWFLRLIIKTKLPSEYQELAQKVMDQLGELRAPGEDQPVFGQEEADKQYAPIGNQFYIKGGRMYEMKHDDDPEYVARALIRALDPVDKITARDIPEIKAKGADYPLVKQLKSDHELENYHKKLAELELAAMPISGGKRASQDEEDGVAAKRQRMDL